MHLPNEPHSRQVTRRRVTKTTTEHSNKMSIICTHSTPRVRLIGIQSESDIAHASAAVHGHAVSPTARRPHHNTTHVCPPPRRPSHFRLPVPVTLKLQLQGGGAGQRQWRIPCRLLRRHHPCPPASHITISAHWYHRNNTGGGLPLCAGHCEGRLCCSSCGGGYGLANRVGG